MDLNNFQEKALGSGKDFITDLGGKDPLITVAMALRLSEEAGEVGGNVKRWAVGKSYTGKKNLRMNLIEEMGDTFHALSQLASVCNITLEEIAKASIKKQKRKGDGLSI